MKKSLLALVGLAIASGASADIIELNQVIGTFTDGDLAGQEITAFIQIEDNGFESGIADTAIVPIEGTILAMEFDIGDSGLNFFTEFDDTAPFVLFDNSNAFATIVGFDYFGVDLDGDVLSIVYDAFAPNEAQGASVEFESFSGDVSTANLSNLPYNVPEPSAFAPLMGLAALLLIRRRA